MVLSDLTQMSPQVLCHSIKHFIVVGSDGHAHLLLRNLVRLLQSVVVHKSTKLMWYLFDFNGFYLLFRGTPQLDQKVWRKEKVSNAFFGPQRGLFVPPLPLISYLSSDWVVTFRNRCNVLPISNVLLMRVISSINYQTWGLMKRFDENTFLNNGTWLKLL